MKAHQITYEGDFLYMCAVTFCQKVDFLISDMCHSVLERIWVKGSYLSQWLPQGERGPPKESKSQCIEILHGGSH